MLHGINLLLLSCLDFYGEGPLRENSGICIPHNAKREDILVHTDVLQQLDILVHTDVLHKFELTTDCFRASPKSTKHGNYLMDKL